MTRTTAIAWAGGTAVVLAAGCARRGAPIAQQPTAERVDAASSISPGTTFCNPLDVDYRFALDTPSRRDVADPVMTFFDGEYFLFAARSGGYWHSGDTREWRFVAPRGLTAVDSAPAVLVLDGRMYFTSGGSAALYTSDDPRAGDWRRVATLASYSEPALLHDDDGRVYLYHVAGDSIAVTELDPRNGFRTVGAPRTLLRFDGVRAGVRPWVTKHGGTYYLEYSSRRTTDTTSSYALFTSRSPTGEFAPVDAPRAGSTGGFIGEATDASMFRDRDGSYWRVATIDVSTTNIAERRLGIFPAGFDSSGSLRTGAYLGDYPRLLPGLASDALDHGGTSWMLLSRGKQAAASSSLTGHSVELAFDEDARSWWSAASGGVGEWLAVDLGRIDLVNAFQINFAEEGTRALGRDEDSYEQYIVESSIDGVHWTTRLDESHGTRDTPHRYVQLDSARNARYVRITNVHAAAGGNFAIRDLRIFGRSPVAPPSLVSGVVVQRQAAGGRATVSWIRSPRASGYVIRFGSAPDRLYSSRQVGDTTMATIDGLRAGPTWLAVDAIGEGGVARGRAKRVE